MLRRLGHTNVKMVLIGSNIHCLKEKTDGTRWEGITRKTWWRGVKEDVKVVDLPQEDAYVGTGGKENRDIIHIVRNNETSICC